MPPPGGDLLLEDAALAAQASAAAGVAEYMAMQRHRYETLGNAMGFEY